MKFFYNISSIYLFFIYVIFRRFFYIEDRNHDGFIDLTELLVAVRGDMNTRRTSLVKMAFNHLDTDKYVFQFFFIYSYRHLIISIIYFYIEFTSKSRYHQIILFQLFWWRIVIPLSLYFSLPIFHPSQIVFLSFSFLSYFISHHLIIFSTSLPSLPSFQSSLFFSLRSFNILSLFFLISSSRSGVVTADEIAAMYDVSHNPDVTSGKYSSTW